MDAIAKRLDHRRVELVRRFAMIEAGGDLDEPGGEIAFAAILDEMRHLRELYDVLLLDGIRKNVETFGNVGSSG